ncbi:hypothetical protein N598_16990 [Klebsiella pneumoniae 303K]|nr:hypothetical protein N598_16990 [Klebsiella pneumoniae 303K]OAS01582.1 hypothetical protein AYO09_27560 [Klebsiella pneumoniae]
MICNLFAVWSLVLTIFVLPITILAGKFLLLGSIYVYQNHLLIIKILLDIVSLILINCFLCMQVVFGLMGIFLLNVKLLI